ncbi:MAG: anhydro-N-acetylmuramic acid kinase, partial [Spirochaetaceae bacterium]|nr:anhydro-N-acetylmuramic acid kinase [Spirochaetaceae bacterium]
MDLIMGMNSGSSFDGIDVVLAETEIDSDGFPKVPKFIKGGSYEWPEDIKKIIFECFENKIDMIGLNRLNYMAGAVFANAATQFIKENNINTKDVKVLGLDTQTLYQEPPDHKAISDMSKEEKDNWVMRWSSGKYPAGYQTGDTSVIANLLDIDTVTHFRQADHVFGGSAAPLMPYLDFILFRKEKKPVLTLNIGGIANIQLASSDRNKMHGFDTGPGNVVSDYLVKKLFNKDYDKNGDIAAGGKINDVLFNVFMDHPFFKRPVPRSGWRLDYSREYLDGLLNKHRDVPKEDIMATACA